MFALLIPGICENQKQNKILQVTSVQALPSLISFSSIFEFPLLLFPFPFGAHLLIPHLFHQTLLISSLLEGRFSLPCITTSFRVLLSVYGITRAWFYGHVQRRIFVTEKEDWTFFSELEYV